MRDASTSIARRCFETRRLVSRSCGCAVLAVIAACSGDATVIETPDTEAVIVNASVDNGTGQASAQAVEATTTGDAGIVGVTVTIYADRNGNGVMDPGEQKIKREWEAGDAEGKKKVVVAGGNFAYNNSEGPLRYDAEVNYSDGSRASSAGTLY